MKVATNQSGPFWILALEGRFDATTTNIFDAEARKIMDKGATRIIIDMENLEFVSSAGLRSMLTLAKNVRGTGEIRFARMRENIKEVFGFSGFFSIFTNYDTLEQALEE